MVIAITLLLFFGEILSSAIFIVSAFHSGNALPSVTVAVATIVVTRLAAMSLREPNETMFLSFAAWILTGYLSIITSLLVVSYGLTVAIIAFFGVIIVMYLVREPPIAMTALTTLYKHGREFCDAALLGNSTEKWAMRAYQNLASFLIPEKSVEDVVGFVHDHSEFNLIVTHSGEIYALIVSKQNLPMVHSLLCERDIDFDESSSLLNWGLLYQVPIVKEEHGLHITDYKVIHNAAPDQYLALQSNCDLYSHSEGLSILDQYLALQSNCDLYSHSEGLSILLRSKTGDNLKSEPLPSGLEARIVAGRDAAALIKRRRGVF
jgi:hypothetical protein